MMEQPIATEAVMKTQPNWPSDTMPPHKDLPLVSTGPSLQNDHATGTVPQFKALDEQSIEPRMRHITYAKRNAGSKNHGELLVLKPVPLKPTTTLKIPTNRPGAPPLFGTPSATRLVPNNDSLKRPTTGTASYSTIVKKEQELATYLASPEASFYPVPIHRPRLDFC